MLKGLILDKQLVTQGPNGLQGVKKVASKSQGWQVLWAGQGDDLWWFLVLQSFLLIAAVCIQLLV